MTKQTANENGARGGRVRIGVLGCADIARRRMLPAMAGRPEIEITAVASRDAAKAAAFTAQFGGQPVQGYARLLEREDVDAVYIALPTGLHAQWIMRALEAGKHVLCEKPLAATYAQAAEAVSLARARGLLLMESFMFLRHSLHRRVLELVREGVVGELRAVTADFGIPPLPAGDIRYAPELGGGALLDVGVYPVRAAQLFLGNDIQVAGAYLHVDPGCGVDVAGGALLYDERGVSARLGFGFVHAYRSGYALWGSAGRLSVERAFTPPSGFQPVVRLERPGGCEERVLPADDQFANIAAEFARTVADTADHERHARMILRQSALVEEVRGRAAKG
ncbi:Gfo/Idh/MocA family oxidoreductase [Streptomyces sp. NPDC006193]|uniref:Gfo/Idh/MocA family protein n=1 Tax=Streptomyces sp. NPDC006193 TaxID=3155717 RepID=UPI0033B21A9B